MEQRAQSEKHECVREVPDLSGSWCSQSGSEMVISVSGEGRLRGTYRSALGAVPARQSFELTGWVSGDLLSFSVSFGQRRVAAWVGQHTGEGGDECSAALWQLAEDVPAGLEERWLWYGFKTGSDTFRRSLASDGEASA